MSKKLPQLVSSSFAAIFASQKSAGKTLLATFVADVLTLNDYALDVFQIDDQKRLSNMLGSKVGDLRPNPDLLIEDPTLLTRAIVPFYDAVSTARGGRKAVLLDTGANEVENLSNFLEAVDYAEDTVAWEIPTLAFVPFLPLDPESTGQAAFTVRRLRAAAPSMRIVMVENRHGGRVDRIVPGSIAERSYSGAADDREGYRADHHAGHGEGILGTIRGGGHAFPQGSRSRCRGRQPQPQAQRRRGEDHCARTSPSSGGRCTRSWPPSSAFRREVGDGGR